MYNIVLLPAVFTDIPHCNFVLYCVVNLNEYRSIYLHDTYSAFGEQYRLKYTTLLKFYVR